MEYFEVLRKCPLFDGIADDHLTSMLACLGAKTKRFQKDQVIFAEGEEAKYIGVVLSGAAQIVRMDYYGTRTILANIEPSQIFGESFACACVKALPIDAIAAADTEIALLDALRMTQTCNNACSFHNQLIYNFLKVVATKNLLFHQKIEITSKRSTREKLMTYLLMYAKKEGDSFTIPFDRQELADYLEVERSGLSAEISKLRNEKVLWCKRNQFRLL
ncbi:MAG: Crp/Fnr family transcriptional regulator [Eubacteriales bacterium]|nr:Crp/Fnr family transcriptional regulator [Eubacteriales bacterium]